jgi:hypothetical protein
MFEPELRTILGNDPCALHKQKKSMSFTAFLREIHYDMICKQWLHLPSTDARVWDRYSIKRITQSMSTSKFCSSHCAVLHFELEVLGEGEGGGAIKEKWHGHLIVVCHHVITSEARGGSPGFLRTSEV